MPEEAVRKALRHKNEFGAGARLRKRLRSKDKIHAVMSEFKRGTLHSGSGGIVKSKRQAIAIALSEARKRGANIPKK